MRLRGSWFDGSDGQAFVRLLTERGFEAYFVGGCVRDDLLGLEIGDIDVATSADPRNVLELAAENGFGTVGKGKGVEFGTVVVIAKKTPFEVTSFRRDVSTDGRRAKVAYHDDLVMDARRRDFTMNALYANQFGKVLDPLGGLRDLEARRVRFIGDPRERIAEDYLRILRFFRMGAFFGDPRDGLDRDGLEAIKEMAASVVSLSRERITHEILGLMAAPDPSPCVLKMVETGIWDLVLPGAESKFLRRLVKIERKYGVVPRRGCNNAAIRRLATTGSAAIAEKLRISRKLETRWQTLMKAVHSHLSAAAMAHEFGPVEARDAILVRAAVSGVDANANLESEIARGSREKFPVHARDLMTEFHGEELGRALRKMKKAWLASGLELNRAELLKMKGG
ncbi:MAG: CCA tRNA nucleotidyltransferase [Albidovulum sp.]|nr:CCA tRNA nucleotidyltransferase [Albidovulum sp.]MDE0531793.1 CCA tRNA nucleotidyltransferase [Albidovulum sp.]